MEALDLSKGRLKEIEDIFAEHVKMKSQMLEKKYSDGTLAGIKLEFVDVPSFNIISGLSDNNPYRGFIQLSRLHMLAMYQMFFQMDYSSIAVNKKNLEMVQWCAFYTAICGLLEHELARIYRGHLGLLQEWEGHPEPGLHLLDRKTLKWDADAATIAFWDDCYVVGKENTKENTTDVVEKIICGAIHGMMFWQRKRDDLEGMEEEKLHHLLCREIFILKGMKAFADRQPQLLSYLQSYEREFCTLFKNSKEILAESVEIENEAIWLEIKENWKGLKKQLGEFAIIPLKMEECFFK